MKNLKINILALSIAGLAMTGCSGSFLDTPSKTESNSTSFYKTETQINYAIVGCYDGYQYTVSSGAWPSLYQATESMSADCLGGGGPDDRSDRLMNRFDISINTSATSLYNDLWTDYYKGIYRCNTVLASLDGVSWKSRTNKTVAESEARAIRGLEYFDLVRLFEKVPLLKTAISDVVPQASADSTYAQVVRDLKFCADSMPADQYKGNSTYLGRITKYAAEAMLARVYLFYDGTYNDNAGGTMPGNLTKAQALAYCEDVIKSGNYSLEYHFKNLWPAACTTTYSATSGTTTTYSYKSTYDEASSEILWVVKFNNDQNWSNGYNDGNRFIVNFGLRNVSTAAPYGQGWGACPLAPNAVTQFGSGDSRDTATVINCKNIGIYDTQIASDAMDYTGYLNKKYCPLIYPDGTPVYVANNTISSANMQTSPDQNWILMRYADVLLMAAELGSSNAISYYNKVVERAYNGSTSHDITSTPTKAQIWEERRKEFMCEGVNYFDLRRQGLDAFVAGEMGKAYDNGSATTGTPIKVYDNGKQEAVASSFVESNIRTKRGFCQIPYTQITLSGNIYTQNAGW
jgi:starch-binding outer membrane protein, SusD/RagB family